LDSKVSVSEYPIFYILIDDFLGYQKNKEIFSHILSLEEHFRNAAIGTEHESNYEYRTNLTCYIDQLYYKPDFTFPNGIKDWEKQKAFRTNSPLLREIDGIFENDLFRVILDSAPYPICKFRQYNSWETQISRYGDNGQFYTWHCDRLLKDTRLVAMVYYVHNIPKKFRGGELCLTNSLQYKGKLVSESKIVEIQPKNDRLIIFNSRTVHSVRPTESPNEFSDGRFSVNIWAGIKGAFQINSQF
jgi:Rps23 Pro-64 3,4-dihydroxylase Tpa1-like proline 4-hydroxylase